MKEQDTKYDPDAGLFLFPNWRANEYTVERGGFHAVFDAITRTLRVTIMGVTKEWIIEDTRFSPLFLTHQADGFAQIEHPIRDDLEKRNSSIVRAALKAALEPHGIELLNQC